MKFVKIKLKIIHEGNESACILTYTHNNHTKTFSNFFAGRKNNVADILCFALNQLKEPCYVEITVSNKSDYNALKLIQGFSQFPSQTDASTIATTKKLLATHRVKFILDHTSIVKITAINSTTKFRTISQFSPKFAPYKKEHFWTLGKHYATKRKENENPYLSAQSEFEKWKKRQQTNPFYDN